MKNSIKVERAKKDLTQEQLAEIVGVTRQTINAIEKNKYLPSTLLALKMSALFGVTVNELFILEEGD
ncbi:helix-turn-helix transcriptional regulator [Pontibacter fetidus]|uniref:Helix-turn-helix transcriptional regulator n=1 Tax=Pontibacter fetidus TaxID=2700082 RepID=A0A6B2H9F4_9BACT|nr:helix-turn-helix transcriptional regulator [Pontibacter fetidus]NDK56790.1 helix-turn-helix transcriptional regulator [Pontibacter fetidus]